MDSHERSTAAPADLLELARRLAADAGQVMLEGLAEARSVTSTKSSATDIVTEVDHACERLIVDGLRRWRPDDGVLGEEGGERSGTSGVRWIVDPIDGTVNYLYGHPGFAVSIAAEVDGRVVAGVVADPFRREVFAARLGGGATLNDRPIGCRRDALRLADALVATGFSYRADVRAAQGAVVASLLGAVRDIRRVGSAALDLCSVAAGRVDAYFEAGLNPWDLAAGALIAAEAGAQVTDFSGLAPPSGPAGALCAHPALHRLLVEHLHELGGARPSETARSTH